MLDDLFHGQMPDGERPDIVLYIFPHPGEFLAVDLRDNAAEVSLLKTGAVFNDRFFHLVESEFSDALREETSFPFAHVINMPLKLEDIIRSAAMSSVLECMGIIVEDDADLPTVVVFIISGGALAMHSERLVTSLRDLLQTYRGSSSIAQWETVIARLVAEENQVLQNLSHQELTEALRDDSPDYFTLWENRN